MEGTCNECVFPLTEEESKGICPTDTSLTYAAGKGKLSCVKELVAAGADVNIRCECHGNEPLYTAARNGHVDCLEELLRARVKVNDQIRNEKIAQVPPTDTSDSNELNSVKVDPDIKQKEGSTEKLSFAANADIDMTTKCQNTTLSGTVIIDEEDEDTGGEINIGNKDINDLDRALMCVSMKGYADTIKICCFTMELM